MRFVGLNIKNGSNLRIAPALLSCVATLDPQCVILTEFRPNDTGALLRRGLAQVGLTQQFEAGFVFVAGAKQLRLSPDPLIESRPPYALSLRLNDLCVIGAYFPHDKPNASIWKADYFDYVFDALRRLSDDCVACVLIGDLNAGTRELDTSKELRSSDRWTETEFARLNSMMTDAWRLKHGAAREYSWVANIPSRAGNYSGWRIDHAFVTPPLSVLVDACDYEHTFRTERLSDHSAIVLDLRLPAA
jgi:exodeoxyribonuclease-3